MIDAAQIPDEVVEAVVSAYNYASSDCYTTEEQDMRAAIAAALNAWPGMHVHETRRSWLGGFSERELMLPLPQEARDG